MLMNAPALEVHAPHVASVYRYNGILGAMTLRCLDDHRHYRVLFHSPSEAYRRNAPVDAESMVGWVVNVADSVELEPGENGRDQ